MAVLMLHYNNKCSPIYLPPNNIYEACISSKCYSSDLHLSDEQ